MIEIATDGFLGWVNKILYSVSPDAALFYRKENTKRPTDREIIEMLKKRKQGVKKVKIMKKYANLAIPQEILREYMKKRGYTMTRLAQEIGKSVSYVNDIDKGRRAFPRKRGRDMFIEALLISDEDVERIRLYEEYSDTPENVKDYIRYLEEIVESIEAKAKAEVYDEIRKEMENKIAEIKGGISR